MENIVHLTDLANLPLSSNQKRLWILFQQDKLNPAYNLSFFYHFKGGINYDVINKSMSILFNKQHTIFSVFKQKDETPYIEIVPREVTVEFIDFSNSPAETRKENIFSFASEDSRKCFDIETGPLYRLYLLKEDDNSYYFHYTFHHIIFDGWSIRLFSQDLSKIYTDLSNGISSDPKPLTFHSYDFAEVEETSITKDEKKGLTEFWKEFLKGCNPELKIVYDFPRKGFSSGLGGIESFFIAENPTKKLKAISEEANSTLFKTLLSVLGVLLQKYTGEDDICIGFPVSERRSHHLLKEIFGFFVGTSVVRLNKDNNCTFKEYIAYASEVTNKAIKNSKLSFDKIVEAVNPGRSNLNPLFQISFSWWNDLIVPFNLNGIIGERVCIPIGVSPFDISFHLWENSNIIRGEIEYNVDVLKQDTILRLKEIFINLVEKLVENPDENLNSVSLITESGLKQISEINRTYTDYPRDKTIVQLFEEQVDLFPDKIALEFKGETVTYKRLNEKANQLALTLRDQGVKCDMPIGILVDKSLEMVIGILGTLKAGGAYLPIDPDYPLDRIKFIIKESGCKIVLTQYKYMELYLEEVNKLDLNSASTYHKNNEDIEKTGKPIDLAYFMYTSGTTGVPKGSMIRNYSVVKLVRNVNYMDLSADDSILYTSAIVFDVTTFEIWGALLNGMTLHIVEKDTILDPDSLGEELFKHQITILHLTSALFTQLAEMRTDIFSKLKYLLVGGDVLSAFHINKVRNANPELKVINCYGPSENTTYSTTFLIDKSYERDIPIGKPVSNSTVYIFDKHQNHQPVGVLGELYVGGEGLSKGYLNRDDLNNSKFINNPYNPKERLYKTGDFGRWLPDGNIEFHGRVDNQIKIRGFRVELEEIESIISKVEGVVETVIKPIKVEEGDFLLVAFVNVSSSFHADDKELGRRIGEKLPYYMVPTAYKFVDSFPKTINGKIDRKALEFNINEFERRDSQDLKVLSLNEEKLLNVCRTLLKTDNILITDNFFEIGGNSLLAVRLINRIKEEFGFTINFREIILNPVIRNLCGLIDSSGKDIIKDIDLVHLNRTTNLPLSSNQRRLWLISKMDPGLSSYIIRFTYKLSGTLNRDIFQKSLEKLFNRHHIVFSVIKEINGEPFCDIVVSKVDISFIDYRGLQEDTKSDKIYELIEADSRKVFDLDKGPLFRLYLIMSAQDEYYFHLCIHHIVFDGWSWSVFVNDLSEIYNSLLMGKEIDLEEIEFQEYDYAHWEKNSVASENEKKSIEFWKENLKGASPMLNFPYDFQRKENPSGRGSYEHIRLSRDLSEKLRRISKTEKSSLFTTLFSAFGILMHKYSGEDDLNIGLPVAYRPHSKLENIFGMFVNTIVVRLKYAQGLTFKNIIQQTSEATMNAIARQDLAFDKVVEIVNPERSSNVNPLFQVAFAWQNNLDKPIKLNGIRSERIAEKKRAAEFDLTLSSWENEGFIEGDIDYNIDILKRETIIRLRNNFLNLVKNLLENPDTAIESIQMISDEEKTMIDAINDTRTDYPKDKTIVQLFEEQVKLYPGNKAVVFKDSSLTYRQLNEKSNQLARVLRNSEVCANDPVAILVDKSVEMIVGIIGILKAGGAYVPLDSEYPLERKNFVMRDSGCKILITQDKFITENDEGIVKFSLDSADSYHKDKSNVEGINVPSDLAYIIYTSGSTGIPKGTLIRQQGVVRLVRNTNYVNFTSEDRVLQAAAIVFDASTEEIFGALLNGATLYIVDKETILDPNELRDILTKNNITIADFNSALFTPLAESHSDIFNNLRNLLIGGDVLSAPHVNKVRKNNPQLTVINAYGPTENSCNSTTYKIDRDFDLNIPIGKPISNSTAYIFDKNMNYQPIGIIGELYVGGDGVSPGYLNRDDLNKRSFVQHPYIPGERLYKTGDYAAWLPDGNIEFHGRIDNQLKIRGFRVELEEIESIVSKIEGVIEAVVLPLNKEEKNIRLVAFLNVPKDFGSDTGKILGLLKSKLPFYMIPYGIKLMYGFPLTINGKTDRRALKYEESEFEDNHKQEEVLSLAIEVKLFKIWSKILKTKGIGKNDNFFESGGNSLLAISLINRLEEELGISISYKDLILHSSIVDLGKYIEENSAVTESSVGLVHLTDLNNLPLTQSQARIWIVTRINPSIPSYIVPFVYRLTGPLKMDIFQRSIDALFSRHHVLFSRIFEREGVPCCVIKRTEVHIEFTDYSDIPLKEGESGIMEFISKDSRKVFDLKNGPLYRLYLYKINSEEFYFYCAIHHIIFDGWSWKIFMDDLNQIYSDLEANREVSLNKLTYQQYDFAYWEKQKGLLKDETKLINYWKGQLVGCSSLFNFPYDFPRLQNTSGFGDKERIKFPAGISSSLRQISKNEGVSLFATMMSAFGILMYKYSGDYDINIGTPIANRSHSSFENVIGMFVNTIVIRMRLDHEITFKNLLRRTNEVILDAITNQDLQFEKIVEIVNPERLSDSNPIFQVAFAWEDNLSASLNLGEVKGEQVFINGGTSTFDITCSMQDNGDYIEGALIYNTDLIRKDTAVRLRDNFLNLVSNIVSSNELQVSSVPIISEEEKQKILSFTETITPYPKDKTIVQLFEEQVLENPNRTAIVFHKESLTYDQLNRRSNQLARTLREKQEIKSDTPIGILVDKSLDLIVGILGILKSGGTYVPIDPEYPGQRINFIVKDSGCRVLLTQEKYMNLAVGDVEKINLNSPGTYKNEVTNTKNINISSDLAYIMYTSGTTGGPKGSMIRQKSVVRLVRNTNYIDITEKDRILMTGAIVFDASTFEIWGTLLNGGSLYIVDKEDILDHKKLGEELIRNEITILWLTSALFTYLAESRTDIFGKLRYLLVGGDVLSASHINKVRKDNPQLKVINGYGPTENTTFSTCFEINKNYEYNIPIGRPISNSTAYIFDKNLNYQPIGVKGELYVGGDGVSRGYLNRDDLNKLSFIEHPFIKGERLYKTGDYARWLSDGNIEFLGRIDNQIKIRGFRIEVEEIEAALSEIEGVVEAVVKPVKVESNDVRLVAFLDVPEGFVIDFNEVSNRIMGKLPPYMVPSAYKTVHGFPMTINGKIDRKALTIDLSEIEKEVKTSEIKELTPTQQKILKIWQDIIKTKSIGITDNFFYIGGNSLLALKVVDTISKEFDIDLDLLMFFNGPRIQNISEFIDIRTNSKKHRGKNDEQSNPGKSDNIIHGKI